MRVRFVEPSETFWKPAELPMPPFVGMMVDFSDFDVRAIVTAIWFDEDTNWLFCSVKWMCPVPSDDEYWLSRGWKIP